jgi:hypothetical protein
VVGNPSRTAMPSAMTTPATRPADIIVVSMVRPAAVTLNPEMASCTAPTTDNPESSTVIAAATTSDGATP